MKTVLFPGQGAQYKGMGKELFKEYSKLTQTAEKILGYSVVELCIDDPKKQLNLTQYTQPALFVVNALNYYRQQESGEAASQADYFMGHSLGEYNALLAAGAFDFATGLKLVQKRGELMSKASEGGMAAVLGLKVEELKELFASEKMTDIDLANYNTPTQIVISGKNADIEKIEKVMRQKKIKCIPLAVSAAFHSRYMQVSQKEFSKYLKNFTFSSLKTPVIANATARPYQDKEIPQLLSKQIVSSVLWVESVRYLMGQGEQAFVEIGSSILTNMVKEIQRTEQPLKIAAEEEKPLPEVGKSKLIQPAVTKKVDKSLSGKKEINATSSAAKQKSKSSSKPPILTPENYQITAAALGNSAFRKEYGVKYAYLAGGMYMGIASKEMVVRLGKAGMMGFLGTGGLSLRKIKDDVKYIKQELNKGESYGMNFLYRLDDGGMELVSFYLEAGICHIEASAFLQITPALVLYRLKGLIKDNKGKINTKHKIIAKISRPEIAELFMSPAPERLVKKLLEEGKITQEEAEYGKQVPMSYDICVEADSGGHTDGGIITVLMPSMQRLKQEMSQKYSYPDPIRLGLAGGIGTPNAAAAAFIMGADFIVTGSINQCTVEAGMSDSVKNMLQDINVQDTEYAPAGDMFELGAKVQVLKKGVFFPARANKLYQLYLHYGSLGEIPEKTKNQLEERYFQKSFDDIWEETKDYFNKSGKSNEIGKAEANPKHKMALIFRWYFNYSTDLAFKGVEDKRVNYQVQTGPALGAFNQWVKDTALSKWPDRHVDEIGKKLMHDTATLLNQRIKSLNLV